MSQLFGRAKPNKGDETIQRTKEKVIDLTKSLSDRQRYLKLLIDQLSIDDLQAFFKSSYQYIFYLFFENFSQVENNITRALSKQNQIELENVTGLLERILTLLPALVHQRWQAHCICNVIKRYFVVCNSPQGVARGIRLFLLWYQILGNNAVDEEHALFKNLIRNWNQSLASSHASGDSNSADEQTSAAFNDLFRPPPDAFRWADIIPIWPKNTSDYEPPVNRWLFFILHTMSDTCKRVLWESNRESSRMDKQEECFRFLFDMFKRYYMPTLFPSFTEQNIYDLSVPITIPETVRVESDRTRRAQACLCRTAFVLWLLPFLNEGQNRDRTLTRVPNPNASNPSILTQSTASSSTVTGSSDYSSLSNELYFIISGSSSKTQTPSLQQISSQIGPLDSNIFEIGQNVLLSTQENINFIHEIFRQSYLMSGENGFAATRILQTVNDWIREKHLRPVFMLEPEQRPSSNDVPNDNHLRLGLNRWLQIFITQSFYLFLVRSTSITDEQQPANANSAVQTEQAIDERSLAGLVTFYKKLPQRHTPDRTTWDLILRVMLKIVRLSLQDRPPPNTNHAYVGNTIKTLLYLFQSASLYVSVELWNNLSDTLSAKANWPEVIDQWDLSMRALTKDLGRLVYKVEAEALQTSNIRRGGVNGVVRRTVQSVPPGTLDQNPSTTSHVRTLSSDDDADSPEQTTPPQQHAQQQPRTSLTDRSRGVRQRTSSDDSLTQSTIPIAASIIRPHLLATIPSNQSGEQHATVDGNFNKQNPVLFSPTDSLAATQQQQQPLTIQITQTPNFHSSDMSSPIHPLDSPMSDDYSTASTGMLDMHSFSGMASGDTLTSQFKNHGVHTTDSRSTTVSESTSTSDHHQHVSPPLSRNRHPLSQSTVDSLHSFPQDSGTIDSMDTATYTQDQNYELLRLAPETAYTAWFRMLGSLGNINQIRSPEQHNRIMRTLFDIWKMLCRIHILSKDTLHGDLYFDGPPLLIFAPWLFEAIQTVPPTHREGKLSAYKLLCSMGVFNHDIPPPSDFLDMFLLTIYQGLLSGDEDVIYAIISSCKVDFFHRCWPSSTLLVPLFTSACCEIGQKPNLVDGKNIPKVEALTILSSLVCFPNHFEQLDVLSNKDKEYAPVTMDRTSLKRMIMRDLIKASQSDVMLESREIALCGLAIFLCEELKHQRIESPIRPFIVFIVECLQPADSTVFAADMLRFLASYAPLFISHRDNQSGQLYTLIIDGLISALRANIPRDVGALMRNNVRIIKSLIFALLDWILHVPTTYLQQQQITRDENNHDAPATIIQRTFSILVNVYRSTNSLNDEQKVQDNELTLSQSIKLCCKFAILFLLNEHSHFPLTENESSLITTNVHEGHDWLSTPKQQTLQNDENRNVNQSDELIIHSPNIQLFVMHDDFLISFIEIPNDKVNELTADNQQFTSRTTVCRTVIRDLCGRYCWDNYAFNISSNSKAITRPFNNPIELLLPTKSTYKIEETTRGTTAPENFDPSQPPSCQNQPPNADILDKILQYITCHSPELAFYSDRTLTDVAPTPALISTHDEKAIMTMINEQEAAEKNYDSSSFGKTEPYVENVPQSSRVDRFALCRSHITQLGLMMFENRQYIDLLNTSKSNCGQLLRELKNLDTLNCRETHKIAVIYIGYGQEDKATIFSNTHGSPSFEEFLTHLGWQVELSKHTNFRGGLHPVPNTYSIYYANALVEIMFHVATMIDGSTDEDRLKKTRHIGNDEVQIIWTEHCHEYDRSIIASAFGDVLIVIHPLPNGLYRIKIDKTSQTTNFGPLFDGAIVDKLILPELVRATAINASRARRTTLNNHCEFYEERYRIINSIIRTHKKETTYEEFLAKSFTPLATKTLVRRFTLMDLKSTKQTRQQNQAPRHMSTDMTRPTV